MSEQRYIVIRPAKGNIAVVAERQSNGEYQELGAEQTVALLNTPAQPAGIVWRKPGEAGRVDGQYYLVLRRLTVYMDRWSEGRTCDGWQLDDVQAWSDLPSPPAWATGGAA